MLFILLCTEGEVTEPEYLNALIDAIKGQSPQSGDNSIDILSVPLGGNQGHAKLVQCAEEQVQQLENDKDSLVHYADPSDTKEKWLICDYDELDESKTTLESLQNECVEHGYTLVINKPNFEYFVLALLGGWKLADETRKSHYETEINRQIDLLNTKNKNEKGFSDTMKIPPYSKKRYVAREIFSRIMHYNPELIYDISENAEAIDASYSHMPKLINRLLQIFGS